MQLHRHRVLSLLFALACYASGCTRETVVATSGVIEHAPLPPTAAIAPPAAASTAPLPSFGPAATPATSALPPSAATTPPARTPVAVKPAGPTRITGTPNDALGGLQFIAGDLDADG